MNHSPFRVSFLPQEKRLKLRSTLKTLRGEKLANAFADKPFGEVAQLTHWINANAEPTLKSDEWAKVLNIINN